MKKTEKIDLFGEDLILSERTAMDVLDLIEFATANQNPASLSVSAAFVVSTSLSCNCNKLKWWQLKKYKLKRLLRTKSLMKKLSNNELGELQRQVFELEGIDLKKKVKPKSSTGK